MRLHPVIKSTGIIYLNRTAMFKKLLFASCLLLMIITLRAKADQKIESKVQKVIVFLNGAQVTRTAAVTVSAGVSTLVFSNISADINTQSVQVNATGDFTILSVKTEMNYLNEQARQKGLDDLLSQQKALNDKINFQNTLLTIDQQEEQMLAKSQLVTGQKADLDLTKLKEALDFATDRLTGLKKKEIACRDEINALNIQLQKINQQINEINSENTKATNNIVVAVQAKNIVQASFTLNYVVNSARWSPVYDIRAKNVNSPITIVYKANVSQHSGEDWKNIKLNLSTGNPAYYGSKPEIYPYYLNLPVAVQPHAEASMQINEVVVTKARLNGRDFAGGDVAQATKNLPADILQTIQIENQTNVEFSIDNPFSVPGDGKAYTVEINQFELPAQYQYYAAPKLRSEVFLTAQLTNWNKYNFLPGEANVFFEGTYIGKSNINPNATADTLNLSLGVDKSIVVTRTLQKDLTEKQALGSNKKETRNWLIDVKSRKSSAINLLVEDQVPVSQNKDIDVEVQELTGGKLDKETGKVSWTVTLNPSDEKKLQLRYQVKYPKNQSVIVQ